MGGADGAPRPAALGVDALALTLMLGAFCARFRDIQPIVNSVMQIAFFMTPVIWKPEQLGPSGIRKLALNPFFDLLEIVRGPILGSDYRRHHLGRGDRSTARSCARCLGFLRARARTRNVLDLTWPPTHRSTSKTSRSCSRCTTAARAA